MKLTILEALKYVGKSKEETPICVCGSNEYYIAKYKYCDTLACQKCNKKIAIIS